VDRALDAEALGLGAHGVHRGRASRGVARGDATVVRRRGRAGAVDAARQLLEARVVEAELVLEAVADLLEQLGAGEVLPAGVVGLHLAVELLDDHRRAPRALLLAAEDVAVDVVADVEALVALDAERALEILQVAALVDDAALEGERGGARRVAVALDERPRLLE